MHDTPARKVALRKSSKSKTTGPLTASIAGNSSDDLAEQAACDEALCAEYERRFAEEQSAEGMFGCDFSDGSLSRSGCYW
jgi:hypothetical protein